LLEELARQVGSELVQEDAVIVFDPSGHKKCGNDSVGVQRQWLGRLGRVDNGQVGVYMSLILEARRGEKYTPAITVPEVRNLLDLLLRQACDRGHPGWQIRFVQRRSGRRELARFHHYRRRNLLAPLRVAKRK